MTDATHDQAPAMAVIHARGVRPGREIVVREDAPMGLRLFTTLVYNAILNDEYPSVPQGWLYTATGAHSLDDLLTRMWTSPDVDPIRRLPAGGARFRDPHLREQEHAQSAIDALWDEFLTTVHPTAARSTP